MKLDSYDESFIQMQVVCNIMYLEGSILARQITLWDLWNSDTQLADCIEQVSRKLNKPFFLEDSGGYKHIVYLELLEERHFDTLDGIEEDYYESDSIPNEV